MTDFTFVLNSTDHRSLDNAVQRTIQALSAANTTVFTTIIPNVQEGTTTVLRRKLVIQSSDINVVEKIQHIDLPHGVKVKAFV